MSFKKALTKMGLVEEEVTVAPKKPQAPTPTPTNAAQYTAPSFYAPAAAPAAADPAVTEMLNNSLKESQLAGFDYMKFVSAVDEMRSSGVPEASIYKMAFSTAKQMGVNKTDLIKSGEHYLGVLKEDEDGFNADVAQYEKKEVQTKEAKIAQLEATMTNLAKSLSQAQQDHDALQQEVQQQKESIETRKASFQVTLQNFRATIESNLQKINQYLQ